MAEQVYPPELLPIIRRVINEKNDLLLDARLTPIQVLVPPEYGHLTTIGGLVCVVGEPVWTVVCDAENGHDA